MDSAQRQRCLALRVDRVGITAPQQCLQVASIVWHSSKKNNISTSMDNSGCSKKIQQTRGATRFSDLSSFLGDFLVGSTCRQR
jgi:hypothetical protein